MSSVFSNDTLWPLGILVMEGPQSLEQHMQTLAVWDDWFSRGDRFISLRIHRDDQALAQAPGTARATKAWLKDGAGENIRNLVSSMVIVTPPASFASVQHLSTEAVFGVAGGIFPDVEEAFAWLMQTEGVSAETIEGARLIVSRSSLL